CPPSTCINRIELGFVFTAAALGMGSLNLRIDSQTVFITVIRAAGFEDSLFVLSHSPGCSQNSGERAASRSRAEAVLLEELKPTHFKSLYGLVALQPVGLPVENRRMKGLK